MDLDTNFLKGEEIKLLGVGFVERRAIYRNSVQIKPR